MIPQCRLGAVLEFAPGRVITILELCRAPLFVGQITDGKHGARDSLNQFGRGFRTLKMFAGGNVSGADECESLTGVAGPAWFWRRFLLLSPASRITLTRMRQGHRRQRKDEKHGPANSKNLLNTATCTYFEADHLNWTLNRD